MIRETYLSANGTDDAVSLANNPLSHLAVLAILFVISAGFVPHLGKYSALHIAGIAGVLSFPAALKYFIGRYLGASRRKGG